MERLLLFPEPFPDESLYSLAVRYHRLVASSSYRRTSEELFGTYSRTCGSVLPCCLGALSKRLNGQYSASGLAESHTLLPLYKPFLCHETYESAIHCMQGTDGTGLKMSLGITASRLLKYSSFRYCNACVQRDYDNYGIPYWHRIHMAVGSCVCPHHGTVLHHAVFPGSKDWRCMSLPGESLGSPVLETLSSAAIAVTKMQFWALNNQHQASELFRNNFLRRRLAEMELLHNARWRERAIVSYIEHRLRDCPHEQEYQPLAADPKWVMSMLRRRGRIVQPFRYYFLYWLFGIDLNDVQAFGYEKYTSSSKNIPHVNAGLRPASSNDLAKYREAFQSDRKANCHDKTGYMWLYRHDRGWLRNYIEANHNIRNGQISNNWSERDFLLSSEVLVAHAKIFGASGKPVKITKTALLRGTSNNYGFLRRREHFPKTLDLLKSIVESECEYQTRKVSWAVKNLAFSKSCAVSVIMRLAGIRVRRIPKSKILKLLLSKGQMWN